MPHPLHYHTYQHQQSFLDLSPSTLPCVSTLLKLIAGGFLCWQYTLYYFAFYVFAHYFGIKLAATHNTFKRLKKCQRRWINGSTHPPHPTTMTMHGPRFPSPLARRLPSVLVVPRGPLQVGFPDLPTAPPAASEGKPLTLALGLPLRMLSKVVIGRRRSGERRSRRCGTG